MPEAKKVPAAKVAAPKEVKVKKVAKAKGPIPKVDMAATYVSTGAYNPKAAHNVASLQAVEALLPADYKTIQAALPEHTDFVGYLIRRGALAPK